MAHEVRLDVFEGPLDLLLHLITRQRVDIYEVSIATITDEYLRALRGLEDLDLEATTGFLVVAATLLELKSIRLLPAPERDEDGNASLLEERDLLLGRLVECATFREAGAWLFAGLQKGADLHPREVPLEPRYADLAPDLLLKVRIADLLRAAERVFVQPPVRILDVSHVAPIRASVRDAILEMSDRLRAERSVTFEELCGRGMERIEVVVRFLGLLELFKAGAVELSQLDRFGAIRAEWTDDAEADEILAGVEEYAFEEGVS
ncbi:MAG: segregation and condensation protein A [Actinomycetota bacterium]